MAKSVKAKENLNPVKSRTPISVEARENKLISLTMSLAEKQLMDGTASSQVMTYFLKLGSEKEQLELEKLKHENLLLEAKKTAIESGSELKELYENALEAMKRYSIGGDGDE